MIESRSRVRVVRAAPGSGKTWLVAEVIRQALGTWQAQASGIAALSFTRVGGDEIRKAVGHELGHPHFVGTIDAFLFRYVLRPHLRLAFPWFASPRLVAGEWGAEHWGRFAAQQGAIVNETINIFGCVCIAEEGEKAIIAHKPHPTQPLKRLTGDDLEQVRYAKMEIWKRRGLLTHSDAALWASKILGHPTLGVAIRGEVIRRFPFLVVDELQDTGHFLGKSIRLLLEDPAASGLLVGDPDQAIYEFTGARPDLFATFEALPDADPLPLAGSQRCPASIVSAVVHIKDSGGVIKHADDRAGCALLVRYSDMVADVRRLVEAVRARRPTAILKVIARARAAVDDLAGRVAKGAPALHCPPLTHIHRAVVAFRQGRSTRALACALAALDRAIFDHECAGDEELLSENIDPHAWKALAVRCLLKANAIEASGTLFDWQAQAGSILDEEIRGFGLSQDILSGKGSLKPKKRKGWDKPAADFLPRMDAAGSQVLAGVPVQTVHGVKGETHDVTIFVCPATNDSRCPSVVWWSTNDKDREEKRIAYVAMTRTRGDLIVCVSESSYKRLTGSRAEFLASFECMTVEECLVHLGLEEPAATAE